MQKEVGKKIFLGIGIVGMTVSVIGTFLPDGDLLQKIFFLIGACSLVSTAIFNKQTMFIALQAVIIVGAILGFFSKVSVEWKYLIMGISALIPIVYLLSIRYFKKDLSGIIGGGGLICIALGFAVSADAAPMLFYSLLAAGGFFVAVYSAIGFFHYKVRISVLWLILNVVFIVNPVRMLVKILFY